jgi:hypothetical protein
MKGLRASFAVLFVIATTTAAVSAYGQPTRLPEPQSAGEAWNVIEESAANVDQLIDAGLLRDVMFQLVNILPAAKKLETSDNQKTVAELTAGGTEILLAIRQHNEPVENTKARWKAWRKALGELASRYPPEVVRTGVYICPMHPLDRHVRAGEKCSVCSMSLVRRHLPASRVYQKPGEATMKMEVIASPLVVGKRADVCIRLAKRDGSRVTPDDLVEVHTRAIHLLINDRSLSDYHHEHPEPTEEKGEYRFSFTPARPGSYRIWADVVPAESGVQEYVIGDIPADTTPRALTDRPIVLSTVVDGRTYTLAFQSSEIHAGQTVIGTLSIAGADGKPFTQLEPVMGAFAHIVGFNEDVETVVHIHPAGAEPKRPEDRGGPAFAFKFYAPAPGFMRLYGQVQINGTAQFAPFSITVLPAEQR